MTGVLDRLRLTVVAAILAIMATLTTACGGPRSSLNTDASVCFRSLAVASGAVHHKGKLVGVRRVSARSLSAHLPEARVSSNDPVCLVAYRSDYRAGDVVDADPGASGHYAVVAVTTGTPTLLGARVTEQLPLRFRHPT